VDLFPLTMRTRSRSLIVASEGIGSLTYRQWDGSSQLSSSTYSGQAGKVLVTKRLDEEIIDDPSPGRGIKQVTHTKSEWEVTRLPSISDTKTDYGNPVGSHNSFEGAGAYWAVWQLDGASTVGVPWTFHTVPRAHIAYEPNQSVDELVRDTVDAFYNENQVDNLLNVVEAPQLVSSLASLSRSVASLRRNIVRDGLLKQLAFLRGSWGKARVKTLLSRMHVSNAKLSDLYLIYSFGIAPLISDMRKVQREVKTIQSRLRKEVERNRNKMVSAHRSCKLQVYYSHNGTRPSSLASGIGASQISYEIKDQQECRRTCTVRGYRNSDYQTEEFKRLDYLMSRFGVTGPASLIWELIPWSFVVDWFLDLRAITNGLDNLLTGSRKKIVDICVSDKLVFTEVGSSGANIIFPPAGTQLCRLKSSIYTRNPITSYNKVGLSGRFGKKQASLSAALLYQQIAKLGK
jgi:hypothetical protein